MNTILIFYNHTADEILLMNRRLTLIDGSVKKDIEIETSDTLLSVKELDSTTRYIGEFIDG